MASIRPLHGKDGRVTSYEVSVSNGRDSKGRQIRSSVTWKPEPGMSKIQTEKALRRFADDYEDKILRGEKADNRTTFAEYATKFLERKERTLKFNTARDYRKLLDRINLALGHVKLRNLRPEHINNFLENLREKGVREGSDRAVATRLLAVLKERSMSRAKLAAEAGVAVNTVDEAAHGKRVRLSSAEKMAAALDLPVEKVFAVSKGSKPLTEKTILKYFVLIHMVLKDAYKNGYVDHNVAERVDRPKGKDKEIRSLQPDEVAAILNALEDENVQLKWKVMTHLLLITGCRRGEIVGLRWSKVDLENRKLKIDTTLLYTPERGLFEDTTKTKQVRFVTVPAETVALLQQYRTWYEAEKASYGAAWQKALTESKAELEQRWNDSDFLFFQEGGWPMHPDSLSGWLHSFTKKKGLPHLNPHLFRHTQASLLIFDGADIVSVSKRLGHAQPSTTTNIYAHQIMEADARNAECIADAILRPKQQTS